MKKPKHKRVRQHSLTARSPPWVKCTIGGSRVKWGHCELGLPPAEEIQVMQREQSIALKDGSKLQAWKSRKKDSLI